MRKSDDLDEQLRDVAATDGKRSVAGIVAETSAAAADRMRYFVWRRFQSTAARRNSRKLSARN